jgi:hypothetical protein
MNKEQSSMIAIKLDSEMDMFHLTLHLLVLARL